MKLATKALVSLLTGAGNRDFWMADLYRFQLKTGHDLRYASSDVNVRLSYRDVIVGSHPIAYYPLNNDTADELPSARDGIPTSLTYVTDTPLNDGSADQKCAVFNGTSSIIKIPFSGGWFRVLRAFTYECWFKGDEDANGTHNRPLMRNIAGRVELHWDKTGIGTSISATTIDNLGAGGPVVSAGASQVSPVLGAWYHLVATWDGVYLRLYVNGVFDNKSLEQDWELYSSDWTMTTDEDEAEGHFRIGVDLADTNYAKGRMAHVALYPYCMPPEQVSYHYEARNGILFRCDGPPVERGGITETTGVEAGDLDMSIYPRAEDYLPKVSGVGNTTLTLRKALSNHYFDLADVTVYRCFLPGNIVWPQFNDDEVEVSSGTKTVLNVSDLGNSGAFVIPTGALVRFAGIIGTTIVKTAVAEVTVRSKLILLNSPVPKNIIKPGCSWALFDAGCGISLDNETYIYRTTIGPGSTKNMIHLSKEPRKTDGTAFAMNYFELGHFKMTSGDMEGIQKTIKRQDGGLVALAQPLPFVPVVGDTLTIFAGCDKQHTTCLNKFNNFQRFRGFPLITPADFQSGFAGTNG